MLKSKSNVFHKFIEFQNMVERGFDTKIVVVLLVERDYRGIG
jgi:hypothetical protein